MVSNLWDEPIDEEVKAFELKVNFSFSGFMPGRLNK
jgi:hypothetical protein